MFSVLPLTTPVRHLYPSLPWMIVTEEKLCDLIDGISFSRIASICSLYLFCFVCLFVCLFVLSAIQFYKQMKVSMTCQVPVEVLLA